MTSDNLDLLRSIAFKPAYVELTKSINAALFLSQAIYWQRKNTEKYFFKTMKEWKIETGLSEWQQEGARKTLRKMRWWKEEKRGMPAKLFFKVDLQELEKALSELNEDEAGQILPFRKLST